MEKKKTDKDEQVLIGIKPMIWSIIHKYNNIPFQEKEDIYQEVSVFVVTKLIPKFDPSKKVKFSAFAFKCITNFVTYKATMYLKKKANVISGDDIFTFCQEHPGGFFSIVDEKEDVAEKINFDEGRIAMLTQMLNDDSSECYLHPNEKNVIKLLFENPKMTQKEISDKLGYSYPSAVSAILNRMRSRFKKDDKFES
jgi:RNA polymerase sigma factor (sigma-70 family)